MRITIKKGIGWANIVQELNKQANKRFTDSEVSTILDLYSEKVDGHYLIDLPKI